MKSPVLLLNASPRKQGSSCALAHQVSLGLEKQSVPTEQIFLTDLDIQPCNACDLCQRAPRYCVIKDDMLDLYPKILSAPALVLSSPIYWFMYSSQLKLCIDRWYGLWNNRPETFRGKPVGLIFTFADEDVYLSGGVNAIHACESLFRYLEAPIAGMVYGTVSSPAATRANQDLMDKALSLGEKLAGMVK